MGLVLWGAIIAFCFNLVMALVFQDVMNASTAGNSDLLVRGIVLALGTFLLGMPVAALAQYCHAFSLARSKTIVREKLFGRVVGMPIARLEEGHSGDLISRCTNDVDAAFAMLDNLSDLSVALFMGGIGFGIIFALSWKLGLAGLALGFVLLGLSIPAARVLRRRSEALQASLGTMTERLSDLLAGLSVARMLGCADRFQVGYAAASSDVAARKIARARAQAAFDAAQGFVGWAQSLGLLAFSLLLFRGGEILVGAVWAVVRVQGNASWLFGSLGQFVAAVQKGVAGGRRVFEVLDEPLERPARAPGECLPGAGRPVLVVRELGFCYAADGTEKTALRGVSLAATQGEVVALVGPSGSGKSTLVKLLLGLYPEYTGEILVYGMDLRDCDLSRLRQLIGYVPQDAYLFDGTIAENIAMGKPGAAQEEIVRAAKTRARPRFHPRAAGRLRHEGRRARREAVGRPAAADRDCPRAAQRRSDPPARRGDLGARHRVGAPRTGRDLGPDAGPDHTGRSAPPLDHRSCRPDPRDGRRTDHRGGDAQRAPRGGEGVCVAARGAADGGRCRAGRLIGQRASRYNAPLNPTGVKEPT